ncbi:MFS transporter [Salininema proteolyticum]|uniref:MFS transporter n=1 Tax=Salininema proteolyticum TaxID=1607685 RepID=A0ABV8U5Z5_9ACTN
MSTASLSPRREPPSLRSHRGFRTLFLAGVGSKLGANLGAVAFPLVAILALDASEGQASAVAVSTTVAALLLGLPAGPWTDGHSKRAIMIASDVGRAAALVSVPLAWWFEVLTLPHLFAAAFLAGTGRLFFDVAQQSALPSLVGRDGLTSANSAIVSLDAVLHVGGRGLGGFLVQALTAPVALLVEAAGYLWSALLLTKLPADRAANRGKALPFGAALREGGRFVFSHPVLRPLVLAGGLNNLASQTIVVMLPFVVLRDLGLSAAWFGAFLAVGGVGTFLGASLARRLTDRLGQGRLLWATGAFAAPFALAVPTMASPLGFGLATVAWVVVCASFGVDNVVKVSLRQRLTPDRLLGRMNSVFRFVLFGTIPLGAALGGFVGATWSARSALWTGAAIMAVQWLIVFFSRARRSDEFESTEA